MELFPTFFLILFHVYVYVVRAVNCFERPKRLHVMEYYELLQSTNVKFGFQVVKYFQPLCLSAAWSLGRQLCIRRILFFQRLQGVEVLVRFYQRLLLQALPAKNRRLPGGTTAEHHMSGRCPTLRENLL